MLAETLVSARENMRGVTTHNTIIIITIIFIFIAVKTSNFTILTVVVW
jgi:hypothetical protein